MAIKLVVRIMEEADLPRPWAAVLISMADNASEDGRHCFPSVDLIAWKAGYKPRQVINILRDMEKAGVIVKVRDAAQHRATEYQIMIDNMPKKTPFDEWRKVHGRGAVSQQKDQTCNPANPDVQSGDPGVQSGDPGVQPITPEPLYEPSNEPLVDEPLTEDTFEQFWITYPKERRVGKKRARQAWEKAGITPDMVPGILAALERQKRTPQWTKNGGQFIPHPTTWINGERWTDEVPDVGPTGFVASTAPEWLRRIANGEDQ